MTEVTIEEEIRIRRLKQLNPHLEYNQIKRLALEKSKQRRL